MLICVDPPDHDALTGALTAMHIDATMLLNIQHGGQLPSGKYKKHDIAKIIWT